MVQAGLTRTKDYSLVMVVAVVVVIVVVAALRYDHYWYLVECCFTSTETKCLLGTGAQDGHLAFHTPPELCCGTASVLVLIVVIV